MVSLVRAVGYVFVFSLFLATGASGDEPLFEERVQVLFASPDAELIPPGDWYVVCSKAVPHLQGGNVVGAGRQKLFSFHTRKSDGEVVKRSIKEIGSLLLCIDGGEPHLERGMEPGYDTGVFWELNIEGKKYFARGATRVRGPFGFPEPSGPNPTNNLLEPHLNALQATVFDAENFNDCCFNQLGSLTGSSFANLGGQPSYRGGTIYVLRTFTPVAP